ncbi:MAG: hypothetical protein NVSMB66_3670 [Candidatus Doudnabacteria bacterium]
MHAQIGSNSAIIPILLVTGTLFLMFLTSQMIAWFLSYKSKRLEEVAEKARVSAEQERIASLPELITLNLMEIPPQAVQDFWRDKAPAPGTFSTRYVTMLIVDREGRHWMGFFNRMTLISLSKAEYDHQGYCIPQGGPGEQFNITPFKVEDKTYTVYPLFIQTDKQAQRWHELYLNHLTEFAKENPYIAFENCYRRIREGRREEKPCNTAT